MATELQEKEELLEHLRTTVGAADSKTALPHDDGEDADAVAETEVLQEEITELAMQITTLHTENHELRTQLEVGAVAFAGCTCSVRQCSCGRPPHTVCFPGGGGGGGGGGGAPCSAG